MVAALKKLAGDDLVGRFSAWWDGREYVPSGDAESEDTEAAPVEADIPEIEKKPANTDALSPAASRIAAIETVWGEGRFGPGSAEIEARLTDSLGAMENGSEDQFGVINTDPATVRHIMGVTGGTPVISEWRVPCAGRFREEFPDFEMMNGDLDRPPFQAESLKLMFSQDAFAYSDHKSGLAVRVFRSLKPGGQWVILDTLRGTSTGRLAPAFASSWSEPQLVDSHEIAEICEGAGFELVSDEDDLTGDVVHAARQSFDRFGQDLSSRLAGKLEQVNKVVYMQELGWEAESWKWRQRALAGELLQVKMWKFRRPAE